jgi:hypothetical protein
LWPVWLTVHTLSSTHPVMKPKPSKSTLCTLDSKYSHTSRNSLLTLCTLDSKYSHTSHNSLLGYLAFNSHLSYMARMYLVHHNSFPVKVTYP